MNPASLFEAFIPGVAGSAGKAGVGAMQGAAEVPQFLLALKNLQADIEHKKALAALDLMRGQYYGSKAGWEPGLREAQTRQASATADWRTALSDPEELRVKREGVEARTREAGQRTRTLRQLTGPREDLLISQADAQAALAALREREAKTGTKTPPNVGYRLLEMVAAGKTLTPGQQKALDMWLKTQEGITIQQGPKGKVTRRAYKGTDATKYNEARSKMDMYLSSIEGPGIMDRIMGGLGMGEEAGASAHEQAYDIYESLTDPIEQDAAKDAIEERFGSLEP